MALTPCASVLAMYSGMIGGFRDLTESGFVRNPDSSDSQSHWMSLKSESGWSWVVDQWKSYIDWLPIPEQLTSHLDSQSTYSVADHVSDLSIILLSIMLYRNMEIVFDWQILWRKFQGKNHHHVRHQ